ncbi:MAG: glycosyltransferase family 39 protein [Candidatus Lernaella stagnicola]|nr:glycosyltransferase family 39 protein [Candidatus Lernaella stagnicola]
MSDRVRRWTVALLLAAGLAVYLSSLPGLSLNTDEVYLPLAARDGHLLAATTVDVHPPTFALLVGLAVRAGLPEAGWRLFSVLAWLATAFLAYVIGRRLAGDLAGILGAALLITSPMGFQLARLVRSYALAALLGAAVIALLLSLMERPDRRRAVALGVVLALGCYTFYYHVFLLAAVGLLGVWLYVRGDAAGRSVTGAALLAGLLFAPWLPVLWAQAGGLGGGWVQWSASPERLARRGGQIFLNAGGLGGVEPALRVLWPTLAGIAATLLAWGLAAWGAWTLRGSRPARALLLVTGIVVIAALAAHLLFGVFIGFHYFVVIAAPLALLAVAPFAAWRPRFAAGVLFALILGLNVLALPEAARQGREPLRQAAQWIDSESAPGDLVLGVAWFAADGYRWYGQGLETVGIPNDLRPGGESHRAGASLTDECDLPALRRRLAGHRRVALLLSHERWRNLDRGVEPTIRVLREAGFVPRSEKAWPTFAAAPTVRAQIWSRVSD